MELEFQRSCLERYEPIADAVLSQEITAENIVPDAFPDVSRVVCTFGDAVLTVKQVSPRNIKIMGSMHLYVLYIPEQETMPRSMHLEMPFQCSGDLPQVGERDAVHATIVSVDADTRMLNPRKLLTRAEVKIRVQSYAARKCEIVCGIAKEDSSIQIQKSDTVNHSIHAVLEKPFSFSDTLRQAPSKPAMEELLFYRIIPVSTESRYIGNKLICKGSMLLNGAYRSGNELIPMQFELPYSQILELEGSVEEGSPEVALILKRTECVLRDGELDVTVDALIQAAIWSQQTVTLLSDLYSTAESLDIERSVIPLCVSAQRGSSRESARKFCECGIPAKQVVTSWASVGPVTAKRLEKVVQYEADVAVELLFLSEDDALCCGSYNVPISFVPELPDNCTCTCGCSLVGDVLAVPVTGGIEVRLDIEFSWAVAQIEQKYCVHGAKKCPGEGRGEVQPSVIIRLSAHNETLWDIAKSCRATVGDICAANELTSEYLNTGTMLIIPTKRS
jgi:hypothetical protein